MAINDYFKKQRVINGLDLSRPVYKYTVEVCNYHA